MKSLFDPVLEYRRFIQSERTEEERAAKLSALAEKGGTTADSILYEFFRGDDILDPAICDRESIEAFAKRFRVQKDPQVLAAIALARPKREFIKLNNSL